MERMIYSYSKIQKCFDKIKSINFYANSKAEHFSKRVEISGLFDFCLENTGCLLFNTERSSEYRNYTKMINQMKQFSKKEMDKGLRVCELYLKNEITSIYHEMESGEINEENDESYKTEQMFDGYWKGKSYEEYKDFMINEFLPERFKECQKDVDRFSKLKFDR